MCLSVWTSQNCLDRPKGLSRGRSPLRCQPSASQLVYLKSECIISFIIFFVKYRTILPPVCVLNIFRAHQWLAIFSVWVSASDKHLLDRQVSCLLKLDTDLALIAIGDKLSLHWIQKSCLYTHVTVQIFG